MNDRLNVKPMSVCKRTKRDGREVTWLLWKSVFGIVISREKICGENGDDSINLAAYEICPIGVVRPIYQANCKFIHFQWWGKSIVDFDEDFHRNPTLFEKLIDNTLNCMTLLHRRGVTHRKLRAKKIFYFQNQFKIVYFEKGSINLISDPIGSINPASPNWDPDSIVFYYEKKKDVLDLGLILLKCINHNFHISDLKDKNERDWENLIEEKIFFMEPRIKDVLMGMIRFDPNKRCSMGNALIIWKDLTILAEHESKSLNNKTNCC